jgi:hypothetical protein
MVTATLCKHLGVQLALVLSGAIAIAAAQPAGRDQLGPLAGSYVCVQRWGLRRDEGYCGLARATAEGQVTIRILVRNRTVWRTRGTKCSAGFNLKDLFPGVEINVPRRCITAGAVPSGRSSAAG